ncbi:MAG: DNA polymerase III subunit gamma/tau [Planctomycetales bacterium]|nr:DNA polymerase III subunit gamma/tau [Planctomycetales bacterium]NIM09895.1 DNA polymerase III subunit gamma/tau [Planctomycetales bacterium]NIN09334.1 DNA polymerase III subunit gamma/tau [Planctomycetales bacterium]NIN78444.1 DNA polymerase III subunit gamma/tau [Planctomycetales bacterium]NIO35634.1 DNA polymerase III subunit gamma/tau [Planctomycetales bacterium]
MSQSPNHDHPAGTRGEQTADDPHYVVVARRYRPQTFEQLIGQEHIAKALQGAIAAGRVGHAYLFTGARGVGKTSAARILAKALDCQSGPAAVPCNACEICQGISAGEDVDVLEIDGASNRGIDEIRQLRANVNIRPSRARFKIYIIDEVHMLTREAFNALLKTLEEPPEHVKFIFCTTEPNKIPVTVLSRCQRFDFASIQQNAIVRRLQQIVDSEGVTADKEALDLLARRAAGSMRDSQSLLEQLLASGQPHLTAAEVNQMLGTADNARLLSMAGQIAGHDAAGMLQELDAALAEGVDIGQLLEQLVGVFRDALVALVGCGEETFLLAGSRDERAAIGELAQQLDLETALALIQILTQATTGLRYTTHRRPLAEVALVRACNLDCLADLSGLIAELRSGEGGMAVSGQPEGERGSRPKKKSDAAEKAAVAAAVSSQAGGPTGSAGGMATGGAASNEQTVPAAGQTQPLTEENARQIWEAALAELSGMVTAKAKEYQAISLPAPNRLEVHFDATYNFCKSYCERPEPAAKIREALRQVTGEDVQVVFTVSQVEGGVTTASPRASRQQMMAAVAANPLMRRASELFGARPVDVQPPREG